MSKHKIFSHYYGFNEDKYMQFKADVTNMLHEENDEAESKVKPNQVCLCYIFFLSFVFWSCLMLVLYWEKKKWLIENLAFARNGGLSRQKFRDMVLECLKKRTIKLVYAEDEDKENKNMDTDTQSDTESSDSEMFKWPLLAIAIWIDYFFFRTVAAQNIYIISFFLHIYFYFSGYDNRFDI